MDMEITLFSKPEELIAWADTFDILLNPSIEDAAILLNYMEGHDYAIGIDSDGKMYRQDIAEENGEIELYPIDDVIDTVCEWNYELILDADAHRADPKDFQDYSEYQKKYESLKADEKRLDRLFDKTCYGKEIIEVATKLADRVISQLGNKENLEKAAVTVAEGVKEYRTGKRGR
ncbi:multidrug transporter [Roseburia hominis]|uniref:multidrug transporter n=1 Tax=Roseburia hominis TaxID=301301 RepID=UPI001F2D62C0|nr:multidrug transporter [Roseburia hominis]